MTQGMDLQAICQFSTMPKLGSAPSTVECLAPQSNEPISAAPAPVPPAHNVAQHQEFLRRLEVYALEQGPELWIVDPITEDGSTNQIRQHMEKLHKETNRNQRNKQIA